MDVSDERSAAGRGPSRATRDLRREHLQVLRMLKVLDVIRTRLDAGEMPPAEDWASIVNFLRVFVDRCHHGKEERVLFPAVLQVAGDDTKRLVEELLVEHVEGRRLVAALAAAAGTDPVLRGEEDRHRSFHAPAAKEAIASYVALIRPHVAHEERLVFPVPDEALAPEFQETLELEYQRIEAEVAGAGSHAAFVETVTRLRERYLPRPGHRQ